MITFDSLKSLYEFVDSMSVRKIGSERVDEHEPQKKRIVYVVEQLSIDRSGRPSSVVNVYDTHDTALDASINVMRSNMKRAGLDDSSHAQHSKYVNFTDDVSNGNRMSAIDEYFQSTVGYTDPVYCYSRIVEGRKEIPTVKSVYDDVERETELVEENARLRDAVEKLTTDNSRLRDEAEELKGFLSSIRSHHVASLLKQMISSCPIYARAFLDREFGRRDDKTPGNRSKIEQIKFVRDLFKCGLKEAKEFVEGDHVFNPEDYVPRN